MGRKKRMDPGKSLHRKFSLSLINRVKNATYPNQPTSEM